MRHCVIKIATKTQDQIKRNNSVKYKSYIEKAFFNVFLNLKALINTLLMMFIFVMMLYSTSIS